MQDTRHTGHNEKEHTHERSIPRCRRFRHRNHADRSRHDRQRHRQLRDRRLQVGHGRVRGPAHRAAPAGRSGGGEHLAGSTNPSSIGAGDEVSAISHRLLRGPGDPDRGQHRRRHRGQRLPRRQPERPDGLHARRRPTVDANGNLATSERRTGPGLGPRPAHDVKSGPAQYHRRIGRAPGGDRQQSIWAATWPKGRPVPSLSPPPSTTRWATRCRSISRSPPRALPTPGASKAR